jgi:hypothetical protein
MAHAGVQFRRFKSTRRLLSLRISSPAINLSNEAYDHATESSGRLSVMRVPAACSSGRMAIVACRTRDEVRKSEYVSSDANQDIRWPIIALI